MFLLRIYEWFFGKPSGNCILKDLHPLGVKKISIGLFEFTAHGEKHTLTYDPVNGIAEIKTTTTIFKTENSTEAMEMYLYIQGISNARS